MANVRGARLVVGLFVAVFGFFGVVIWIGMTGGSQHVPQSRPGIAFVTDPVASGSSSTGRAAPGAAKLASAPLAKTVADRQVRDDLRRRILAGWAEGESDTAAAARAGRVPAMPESPDGGIDPAYIRGVIRDDFVPMARSCYEELLARDKAARGTLELKLKIVGDEKVGGVVDEVEVASDGGLADDKLRTCIRESMLSVAFRPPPRGGWVTVTYPLHFAGDAPDGGSR